MIGMGCAACGGPWTARVCSSNASGACRGSSPFSTHYTASSFNVVKLANGLTDVQVRDPSCPNGIGSLDVTVVDADTLDINVYCLSDQPPVGGGTMTLPPTGAPHPAPTSAPPPPPSGTMTLTPAPTTAAPAH
ncbi:MAG TPA: hypothetical protein VER96_06610 [Polyangiaceae bacterium]|nr:hypothetical protein [Polyangiaceae bacterium]